MRPSRTPSVRGDTLWDISKLFLRSPWRWPELWGMNLEQIKNPHLIYPGQVLYLVKVGDRAMLRVGQPVGRRASRSATRSSCRRACAPTRSTTAPFPSIPLHLIGPFLNEAVVFSTDELATAPRIVASQEGRVLMSRGETAYVRGDLKGNRDFRVFRDSTPLVDPDTGEVLGFEARYVGTAEFVRDGGVHGNARRQEQRNRASDVPHDHRSPGGRRRRPPGAGAAARLRGLRAARPRAAAQGPHHLDLRRGAFPLGRTRSSR